MSEIDKDFEAVAAQINAKLKEAADALREANKLGDSVGLPGLIFTQWLRDDLAYRTDENGHHMTKDQINEKLEEYESKMELIKTGEFEDELGNAGWSTSSSYC